MVEVKVEQVEGGTPGSPPAVAVTVGSSADLSVLGSTFTAADWEEAETFTNLASSHEGEIVAGKFVFEIPGDEAGEVADLWDDLTTPSLWEFLQEANERAVAKAAGEED